MDSASTLLAKCPERQVGENLVLIASDVELSLHTTKQVSKADHGDSGSQLPVLVRADYTKTFPKPTSLRGLARLLTSLTDIRPSSIEPQSLIGKGSYSVVYRSYLTRHSNGARTTVAIKRPRAKTANNLDNMTFFCEEGVLMKMLSHRAIVKAFGFGGEPSLIPTEQLTQAFIVEEYLPGGTLLDLLENVAAEKIIPYTLDDAFRWMVDAADAIQYLHNMRPAMVIHRDIKPDNILLDNVNPSVANVKLTDFGLHRVVCLDNGRPSSILEVGALFPQTHPEEACANPMGEAYKLTGGTGSVMYMAPEVMQKICYNEKVDVFAFAVVMYEVFSGILLRNLYISDKDKGCAYRRYATRVNSGWRPPMPVEWPDELRDLIADCWSQQPACRPSMQEVLKRLQALQHALSHSRASWSSRLRNTSCDSSSASAIPSVCLRIMERLCCMR